MSPWSNPATAKRWWGGGTIERVFAIANGAGAACRVDAAPTTILSSVCAGRFGLFDILSAGFPAGPFVLTLRNDTIYGLTEPGLVAFSEGPQFQITAINTIVHGGGAVDLETGEETGGTVEVTFKHSNYASVEHSRGGTVTAPGTATNQVAPPYFVDAANGNFREFANSPTVDAGINEAANGTMDAIGSPRTLAGRTSCTEAVPAVTDIGAFEFAPVAVQCPRPPPPNTLILKAKLLGPTATFRFKGAGSGTPFSFECKLDKGKFRRCTSPKTYRHLRPGQHRFAVRAVGPGGVDASAAVRKFRVRRRTH